MRQRSWLRVLCRDLHDNNGVLEVRPSCSVVFCRPGGSYPEALHQEALKK